MVSDASSNERGPYLGLTWDHPRGYEPLAAAAHAYESKHGRPIVKWHVQPLAGFEEHPIADLAARYDLLVLDHPHIGEAVASGCLMPLETYFSQLELADWQDRCVGRAMASYEWAGKHWALPIDVASQVCAYRPDRVIDVPENWESVVRLGERMPVSLSLAGPHAFLSFLSICAALGAEPLDDDSLLPEPIALEALILMERIDRKAPAAARGLNPIELLELMASSEQLAAVPLIFGYVNYAAPRNGQHRIAFSDSPTASPTNRHGSVLGGTGIAISTRARISPGLISHLRELLSVAVQRDHFPAHEGQPSARAAWTDPKNNARWSGFYASTLATVETALLRPRYDGYIAFQAQASAAIRDGMTRQTPARHIFEHIRQAWRRSRSRSGAALSV